MNLSFLRDLSFTKARVAVGALAICALFSLLACQEDFATKSVVIASQDKSRVVLGMQPTATATATAAATASPVVTASTAQYSSNTRTARQGLSPEPCDSLQPSPPRGLSCIHCLNPRAKTQSNVLIGLLQRSCLQTVALNYLVDAYFGYDEQQLKDQISQLSSDGRKLVLEFYLSNGAGQRRWRSTTSSAFGVRISPEEFRTRIRSDYALQSEYQQIVVRLLPVIKHARQLGASVLLVPSLEDNLDNEAFNEMYHLTRSVVSDALGVRYGRSACPGCYDGNEEGVPPGVFREDHTAGAYSSISGGVISNDGSDYEFGASSRNAVTLNSLRAVQSRAAKMGNVFILWSAERQGLPSNYDSSNPPPPDSRTYAIPGTAEQEAIIAFLRDGL